MKTVIIYCALIKKKCTLSIVDNVEGLLFSLDNVHNNAQYDNELGVAENLGWLQVWCSIWISILIRALSASSVHELCIFFQN